MVKKFLLGFLLDRRLRVISPIEVSLSKKQNKFIAIAFKINEFGYGINPSEAIIDLQHTIAELYFFLNKNKFKLGVDLQHTYNRLQSLIKYAP